MPPNTTNQPPVPMQTYQTLPSSSPSLISRNKIFLYALHLSLALTFGLLGFLGVRILIEQPKINQLPIATSPSPNNLPPKLLELLKNPIFTHWSGSVQGIVSEKTPTTLTLERDGQKLIFNVDSSTKFIDYTNRKGISASPSAAIPYEQVSLGTKIGGQVQFVKDDKGNLLSINGKRLSVTNLE